MLAHSNIHSVIMGLKMLSLVGNLMWTVFIKNDKNVKQFRRMYTCSDLYIDNERGIAYVKHNDDTNTEIDFYDVDVNVDDKIVTFYLSQDEDENTEVPSGTSKAIKW